MELAAIEEDQIVRLGAVVYVNAFIFLWGCLRVYIMNMYESTQEVGDNSRG